MRKRQSIECAKCHGESHNIGSRLRAYDRVIRWQCTVCGHRETTTASEEEPKANDKLLIFYRRYSQHSDPAQILSKLEFRQYSYASRLYEHRGSYETYSDLSRRSGLSVAICSKMVRQMDSIFSIGR